jgi:hypothetical protein
MLARSADGPGQPTHRPHPDPPNFPLTAILGAARLAARGRAPADERSALYRSNPSPLDVTAVTRYARLIRREPRAFHALHAWRAPVPHTVER